MSKLKQRKRPAAQRPLQKGPNIARRVADRIFDRPDADLAGTLLGNQYRLIEIIKRGGVGVIYRARQETVQRDVAVKILHPHLGVDSERARRFEAEASILGRLRHPNTIRLYDCGRKEDGSLFLVTELLHGESLRETVRRGPLPIALVLTIAEQICASLAEAHACGFIHRDLKAENVFLDRVGDEDHVKVLDFGIAKQLSQPVGALTPGGLFIGTPDCMAPEQIGGRPGDARSDIYGLGVLIHQMVTGALPFGGESQAEILVKHLRDPPPSLGRSNNRRSVPVELEVLVEEMLRKAPESRPRSMDEVRKRLKEIANKSLLGASVARLEHGLRRQWQSPLGRWGLVLGGGGVALLIALRVFVAPLAEHAARSRQVAARIPPTTTEGSKRQTLARGILP